jgi:hypothetical protein
MCSLPEKPVQKASALEKLAAAHQSIFAPHSQGIWVESMMPMAVNVIQIESEQIQSGVRISNPPIHTADRIRKETMCAYDRHRGLLDWGRRLKRRLGWCF